MKKITLALFTLGMLAFSTTFAANRPGAVTFTPGVAYYHFANKRQLDNIPMPNASLAYNFNDQWAVEGFFGLINADQNNFNRQGVHGGLYTIDTLYRLKPHGSLEPYVDAGIGIISMTPNGNNSEQQSVVNLGVGTEWFCDRSIALRGEARDVYTLRGGKNDVMLNFGVSFLMGGN